MLSFQKCPMIGGIEAGSLRTTGTMFLRHSAITGRVFLGGAEIGGNVECDDTTLEGTDGDALIAHRLTVTGDLFLRDGFSAKGAVRLLGARIGGDVDCSGATLAGSNGRALATDRMTVTGGLFLREGFSATGKIDFGHATVGVLFDDAASWPSHGQLHLSGFIYESLGPASPFRAQERLEWLSRRQDRGTFDPQPYEQLAKVLKAQGHGSDARAVLIAKERDDLRSKRAGAKSIGDWFGTGWLMLMDRLARFGYEPWRVLPYAALFWAVGWVVFNDAERHHAMVPAKERVYMDPKYQTGGLPPEYPRFNAAIYSADVFFPFVDLHQETEWRPATERVRPDQTDFDVSFGVIAKVYTWLHIALGWFLSGIGVATVTDLVKRD